MSNRDENTTNYNSWPEWSRYVLAELERLNDNIEYINKNSSVIKTDVSSLMSDVKLLNNNVTNLVEKSNSIETDVKDINKRLSKVELNWAKYGGVALGFGIIINILIAVYF